MHILSAIDFISDELSAKYKDPMLRSYVTDAINSFGQTAKDEEKYYSDYKKQKQKQLTMKVKKQKLPKPKPLKIKYRKGIGSY